MYRCARGRSDGADGERLGDGLLLAVVAHRLALSSPIIIQFRYMIARAKMAETTYRDDRLHLAGESSSAGLDERDVGR